MAEPPHHSHGSSRPRTGSATGSRHNEPPRALQRTAASPSTTRGKPEQHEDKRGYINNLKLIIKRNPLPPEERPQPPVCRVCLPADQAVCEARGEPEGARPGRCSDLTGVT